MAGPDPPSRMTSIAAWLQPRDLPSSSSRGHHGVGVDLTAESDGGCVLIASMEVGGPASRSGVCMVGDELLKVDGKVVEKAPVRAIQDTICGRAGTALSLTLRRARQGTAPMLYEVELVRGDAEFMEVQARNKVLSRENTALSAQVDQLQNQLQEKDEKLQDMIRDLNEFDKIASRAQEARRCAEQQCAHAESEALRLKNSQKNVDEHVSRLVAELREKERKLQLFTGKGKSRSVSPVSDANTATTVMGDASVQLPTTALVNTSSKLEADLRNALVARDQLQEQLRQKQVLTEALETKCREFQNQIKEQVTDTFRIQQAAVEIRAAEKLAAEALTAKSSITIQFETIQEQLFRNQQKLQQLSADNASLTAQLSESRQELASSIQAQYLESQHADGEMSGLKLELDRSAQELRDAQEKLKTLSVRNDVLASAAADHQHLLNEHATAQNELAEVRLLLKARDEDNEAQILALQNEHREIVNALQHTTQQLHDAKKIREESSDAERSAHVNAMEVAEAEAEKSKRQLEEFELQLSTASQTIARLEAKNASLCETSQASGHGKLQLARRQVEELQHELATLCICIVTHDVDLASLISTTEPYTPLGEASAGSKLYSREMYQHTLGVLKDAKTPRKLLAGRSGTGNNSTSGVTPVKEHMTVLQRQMAELQVQMADMQKQALLSKEQGSPVRDQDDIAASSSQEAPRRDNSEMNKENQDNKLIPILTGADRKGASKPQTLPIYGARPPSSQNTPIRGQSPVSSAETVAVRTEHRVMANSKPTSKPLVLATRVTQVNTSFPPADTGDASSEPEQRPSSYEDDESSIQTPKVSRLKAFFQGQSPAGNDSKAHGTRSPLIEGRQIKSPRLSRSMPQKAVAEIASGEDKSTGFDSSTAPTDVEDKLMGPLFASHKTGAALLKEAAVEPAMDDESDYSTDATRNDVSSLQLSPLVEDPSSLINKYLNCSGDDSHTTPKSGNPNKLTISVSPDGDPLVGPLRSPQEIVAAMGACEVKSALKKSTGPPRGNLHKRTNIEFNEELSEVRLFTPDKVKYANQLFGAAEVQHELDLQQQSLFQDYLESGYADDDLIAGSYGEVAPESEDLSDDNDDLLQNTKYNASSLHSFC